MSARPVVTGPAVALFSIFSMVAKLLLGIQLWTWDRGGFVVRRIFALSSYKRSQLLDADASLFDAFARATLLL